MTKNERIFLIGIAAQLETVIEGLNEVAERTDDSDIIDILWKQGTVLHSIKSTVLRGGASL